MAANPATVGQVPATEARRPISARSGVIPWLRQNLFNTPLNSLLSIVIGAILLYALIPLVQWAFINAVWVADSKAGCEALQQDWAKARGMPEGSRLSGACWALVVNRFDQYVYGLYPIEQRWRINLAAVLLVLGMIPLFLPRMTAKLPYALGLIVAYPIIGYVLFRGGMFGLVDVEPPLWGGLFLTLVLAITGIVASLPLGVVLALGRRSKMPVIKALSVAFIEVVRGVPLVSVLFMASVMLPLFLPQGVTFDKLLRALVGVSLFSAAYMAEVVRGGLQAIPKGQYEAADAMGLGYWQSMGLVILPQALKLVIPGIVNTFIGLFKDTSLVLIIGLFDLLGMAQLIIKDPLWLGLTAETYVFAALGFWIFCFGMSRYSMALERKLQRGHQR